MRGLILLTIVTLVYAKNIEYRQPLTAYGYIKRVAIPLAEEIRKDEEAYFAQDPHDRVAGGSSSALGQFPYQVP